MQIEKLAQARLTYRARLVERVEELTRLLGQAAAGDVTATEPAQRLAHRIYGSAGTFGFAEVGDAARVIDQQLLRVRSGEQPASPQLFAALGTQLERARADLAAT
jgi:HPt (histidine-containing phosphotransfer) domain-containing protein